MPIFSRAKFCMNFHSLNFMKRADLRKNLNLKIPPLRRLNEILIYTHGKIYPDLLLKHIV